ncbi:MAG TPA: hypothetical protein VLJ39_01390 [Tepidisphaeraceae bacterium]|nr:hypothetical protein [Tepidisphaeraceae bacterium]
MQPRSLVFTLSLAALLSLPAFSFGAGGIVVPGGPGKYGNNGGNMQSKGAELKDQTLRFLETAEKGKKIYVFTQIDGTRPMGIVPTSDDKKKAEIETTLGKLQKGDVAKMTLMPSGQLYQVTYIKKIEVKPNEENPHAFVYQESYNDQKTGEPLLRLTKYDVSYEVTIPSVRGEKGKTEADPEMVNAVQSLKAGEVVYAQITNGRPPVVTSIFPYKDPQTGKVTKVSMEDVEGGKTESAEIETADGKTVTVLVPGKVVNKHFTQDQILSRLVHGFKPGTEVVFLSREQDGKNYLVEITKAPPAPKAAPASKTPAPAKASANAK